MQPTPKDIVQGAATGALLGVAVSYLSSFFRGSGEKEVGVEGLGALDQAPALRRAVATFADLRHASASAEALYVKLAREADALAGLASSAAPSVNQFRCNRMCNELKLRCKQLCVEAGRNAEYAVLARQVHEDEMHAVNKFCSDFTFNMILGS